MADALADSALNLTQSSSALHAKGSALDLRTSSLLDSGVISKGDRMRQRPGTTADAEEAVELATLNSRRSADRSADGASLRTLESGAQAAGRGSETPAVDAVPAAVLPAERRKQERRALQCFAALCVSLFMCGWNDGSTGPLLPTIQDHYGVSIAAVSP